MPFLRSILPLIILLFYITTIFAQNAASNFDVVKKLMEYGDYEDAAARLETMIKNGNKSAYTYYLLGICQSYGTNLEAAYASLSKAYELNNKVAEDVHWHLGKVSHLDYQFDLAIQHYKYYLEILQTKQTQPGPSFWNELLKVNRAIEACENAKVYYQRPFDHIILNMGKTINTAYTEYTPVINAENNILIFTARRPENVGGKKDKDNKYFEDIWMSVKDKESGQWMQPVNVGPPVNTAQHDACISLSPDGKTMYLYKSVNGGDIYYSKELPDGKWSDPQALPKPINSKYKEASFTISSNGKTIYFSSDRPGGYGGLDIYTAELQPDGSWSEPVNLGSLINSEFDEDSPFLENDGLVLYFSSNGHNTMGGYDIFSIRYDAKKKAWSNPVNVGYPINSPQDDIYFTIAKDKKTAYFASAKKDGLGEKDIYMILLDSTYELKSQKIQTIIAAHGHEAVKTHLPAPKIHPVSTVQMAQKQTTDVQTHSKQAHSKKPAESKDPVSQSNLENVPVEKPNTAVATGTSVQPVSVTEAFPKSFKDKESTAVPTGKDSKTAPLPTKAYDIDHMNDEELKSNAPKVLGTTTIKGRVTDDKKQPLIADVYIKKIHTKEEPKQIKSNVDGTFSIEIPDGYDYAIDVEKPGYLFFSDNIDLEKATGDQILLENVVLITPKIGSRIILKNIFFRKGSPYLNPESRQELQVLLRFLNQNPQLRIRISGHTDNTGSHEVNFILSEARAKAVYDYLISKGIDAKRLEYIGYGEDKPIASNATEDGRLKNRRTEFEIIP